MTTQPSMKKPRASSAPKRASSVRVEKPKVNPFEETSAAPREKQAASEKPANVQTRLREARLQKRLLLEDCAQHLCIRRVQLEAIEDGRFDELPSTAHGIGFIRSYADYLGLPSDKIVEQYRRETRATIDRAELHFPVPVNDSRLPSRKIILLSILGLIVLITGWNWLAGKTEVPVVAVNDIETASPETPAADIGNSAVTSVDATELSDLPPAPTVSPAPPVKAGTAYGEAATAGRVELYAQQDTWMQVRDTESNIVFSRVLHAGDSYKVPQQAGLTLTVGNAAGLQIKLDGATLPPLGMTGQIIKNLPLDPDALKK